MSTYRDIIKRATGCTDPQAAELEDVMRNVIFQSTLDWQTRDELEEAARLGLEILRQSARWAREAN
jgi:hypothetical protein